MIIDWRDKSDSNADKFYCPKLYDADGREIVEPIWRLDLNTGWAMVMVPDKQGYATQASRPMKFKGPLRIVSEDGKTEMSGVGADEGGVNTHYYPPTLKFTYTPGGMISSHELIFHRMVYGSNEKHPEPQWLIQGMEVGIEGRSTFALKDIIFSEGDRAIDVTTVKDQVFLACVPR